MRGGSNTKTGFILVVGLLVASCEGVIGGGGAVPFRDDSIEPSGEPFGAVGSPSESDLLRLTKVQHKNTVSGLLNEFLGASAKPVLDAVEPVYAIIPDDTAELEIGGLVGSAFSRMAQSVGELHVRGYFEVAMTAANAIAFDQALRAAMFGDCINDPVDDHGSCVEALVESFGLWAMRRPLSDSEVSFFVDTVFADDGTDYQASPEAIRDLLVTLMTAPELIYRVNVGGEEIAQGIYELTPYELASRLSYHFWNSMPDQELFDAAEDGRLATESGYAEQVERLYRDPRARATFESFVFEWLELYKAGDPFGGVTSGDPQKLAFIEGYDVTPALRDNMVAEVLDMAEYNRQVGSFEELFTSRVSFAKTTDLAAIYDVAVWDGVSMPEPFPDPERVGVLGRAALLASSTVATHPILRGVRIRQDFLCDSLGVPPANVNEFVPEVSPMATTRERTESLTSPGSCSGCHTYINGLGFPLEAFDSLGRYREEEMLIDNEGLSSTVPLDLEATPYVDLADASSTVSGPAELIDALLDSGKLEECFARHYVRFTLGLLADPAFGGDPDTVSSLAMRLQQGDTLGDVFKAIAFSPAFKQRLKGGDS